MWDHSVQNILLFFTRISLPKKMLILGPSRELWINIYMINKCKLADYSIIVTCFGSTSEWYLNCLVWAGLGAFWTISKLIISNYLKMNEKLPFFFSCFFGKMSTVTSFHEKIRPPHEYTLQERSNGGLHASLILVSPQLEHLRESTLLLNNLWSTPQDPPLEGRNYDIFFIWSWSWVSVL